LRPTVFSFFGDLDLEDWPYLGRDDVGGSGGGDGSGGGGAGVELDLIILKDVVEVEE